MTLDPRQLLYAYSQGIFPMAGEDGAILWYDPDPRAILPLKEFRVPRRLARTVRQEPYEVRVNTALSDVITYCAAPSPGREQTWINPALIEAYTELHRLGFAHSVEAWQDGQLVGGLYGVALNSLFAGESMFSRERDASKVALVHLVRRLRQRGFLLLDIQFLTDHLAQFGAIEIPRSQYKTRLQQAMLKPNRFDT
ncbi:MAG TPA: leucyl/phenylalanyl-tRNA--protein transferase [Candidatus Sulfomarinibacteraceae bacterium]|nr:leucyl/phenylalanyl-tRNA--protein transferase [Candidatus Sulfomarinibacteraceae bacterium]